VGSAGLGELLMESEHLLHQGDRANGGVRHLLGLDASTMPAETQEFSHKLS
jgi:hypothetical protein